MKFGSVERASPDLRGVYDVKKKSGGNGVNIVTIFKAATVDCDNPTTQWDPDPL